ncbi:MAG: cupin domain-containing protein [Phycisphaerales bacterium]|nr:cupin domain-containing protein [Phycisphaerales bacterium]
MERITLYVLFCILSLQVKSQEVDSLRGTMTWGHEQKHSEEKLLDSFKTVYGKDKIHVHVLLNDIHKTVNGFDIVYPGGLTAEQARIALSSFIVTYAPHTKAEFHCHLVPELVYVLQGTMTCDYGSGIKKVFGTGSCFVQDENVPHRTINKSDSDTLKILTIFIGQRNNTSVHSCDPDY